jgi:hypothetical protein
MTDIQLRYVHHWTTKKRDDSWQMLGEMLGVYWTSDKFVSTGKVSDSPSKRRKVLLPLAGIIAPDTLQKTLDKVLDKTPETPSKTGELAKTVDGHYSLDSMPLDKYKELFDFAVGESTKSPETPADRLKKPNTSSDSIMFTDAFNTPKLDIDKIKNVDPELAKHLDPDYQW